MCGWQFKLSFCPDEKFYLHLIDVALLKHLVLVVGWSNGFGGITSLAFQIVLPMTTMWRDQSSI